MYVVSGESLLLALVSLCFARRYDKQKFMTHTFMLRSNNSYYDSRQNSVFSISNTQNMCRMMCKAYASNWKECMTLFLT